MQVLTQDLRVPGRPHGVVQSDDERRQMRSVGDGTVELTDAHVRRSGSRPSGVAEGQIVVLGNGVGEDARPPTTATGVGVTETIGDRVAQGGEADVTTWCPGGGVFCGRAQRLRSGQPLRWCASAPLLKHRPHRPGNSVGEEAPRGRAGVDRARWPRPLRLGDPNPSHHRSPSGPAPSSPCRSPTQEPSEARWTRLPQESESQSIIVGTSSQLRLVQCRLQAVSRCAPATCA